MDTRGLPPTAPSRGRRALRPVLLALALAFVAWTMWDLVRRWDGTLPNVRWGLVALGCPPIAIGVLIQAWAWTVLLRRMTGKAVSLRAAVRLHVDSMLARYTPGKVGLPIVRMAGADAVGVSAATVVVSIALEMLSFTAVGGVVGFGLLALGASRETTRRLSVLGASAWPLLGVFALITLLLLTLDRRRIPKPILSFMRIDGVGPLLPATLPLFHLAYWATWAVHGYAMTLAVGGSAAVAFASSGLYILAVVIGFLAMVAPAGAGVREAVISLGVADAVGASATLGAVLISRVVTLTMEIAVWLGVRLSLGKARREPPA